ncbi:MAG: histidine kinase [Flavisolibacter sp.]|nr:histidine kinase [Flavisolibacter sp.]
MLRSKYFILLAVLVYNLVCSAQHPNFKKIDSLKKRLPATNGIQRVDCLNALCEEYWWPPRIYPDSISAWANAANKVAENIHYTQGIATSLMMIGAAETYKRNFSTAEKYLRKAISIYETTHSDFGLGWGNLWLGQCLYSQNKFTECLARFRTAIPFLQKSGDWDGEAKAWGWIGVNYATLGNYDSSFSYLNKCLQLRQKMSDHTCIAASYVNMGHFYKMAGSYDEALGYYKAGYNYALRHNVDWYFTNWAYLESMGVIYRLLNAPDSSYYYLRKAIDTEPHNQIKLISFAETLLMKNQYDSALAIFLKPLDQLRRENDRWDLMRVLLDVAKAYERKKENKTALPFALESFSIAKEANTKQYLLEAYWVLSRLYSNLKKNDSAYFFLQQYTLLKDSIANNRFLWRLAVYKEQVDFKNKNDQIALLDKDNKIKADKLKQEAMLKWVLLAGLLITALSGFMIFKNLTLKRKNEKLESRHRQAELQHHVTELEMQALRAQMNPHFIFNCLNSINRFILKNETEAASNYLTKFSRLIRMVLTFSKQTFIPLEDELEMLRLYLDMERLRFKDAFDYSFIFTNSIDAGNVLVPPLLLQPFAENAIWHGLMHKEGHGHLEIALHIDGKVLTCTITDDGVGRNKAAEIKSKSAEQKKSMGLQITSQRLALLNKDKGDAGLFHVEDIVDKEGNPAGTRVILKVYYKELVEVGS